MNKPKRYIFSHNDTEETAQEVKDRTAGAVEINQQEFTQLIGKFAYTSFSETFGPVIKAYQSKDFVYASIQNIDYVFQEC